MKKVYLIFIIMLLSCDDNKNLIYEQDLEKIFKLENFHHIVIIPYEGCIGCISDAANSVREIIDDNQYLGVLFTKVKDKKLLKLKMGEKIFNYDKRVKIDDMNLFSKVEFNTLYPLIITIKKGKVIKVQRFNNKKLPFN